MKKETGIGAVAAITTLFRNIRDVHGTHMKALSTNGERGTESWKMAQECRGFMDYVISDTKGIMASFFDGMIGNKEYYIYRVDWVPVVVMQLLVMSDRVWISNLLAHPHCTGACGAMVQVAVNAKDWGCAKPVVELHTLSGAQPAYTEIGFVIIGASMNMKLDLNTPHPKWNCLDGYWQYTPSSGGALFLAQTNSD
ncbi:MAG: hypothetical protein ABW185_04310 [Sedimenticola sp.]